jgi:hypothetical protein
MNLDKVAGVRILDGISEQLDGPIPGDTCHGLPPVFSPAALSSGRLFCIHFTLNTLRF